MPVDLNNLPIEDLKRVKKKKINNTNSRKSLYNTNQIKKNKN